MARFVDRLWELKWLPPQALCYLPRCRDPAEGGYSVEAIRAVFERQRARIAAAPAYVADDVGRFFFYTSGRDRSLRAGDFPVMAVPRAEAWIEFRRPDLGDMAGAQAALVASQLPHWWGWLVTRHGVQEYLAQYGGTARAEPSADYGVVCRLYLSADDRNVFGPVVAFGLQLAAAGEICGGVAEGFAFDADPAKLLPMGGQLGYFRALFLPVVATMAFLACDTTVVRPAVDHAEKLQKARRRRGKRPLAAYRVVDATPIQCVLRLDGQAGIAGLATALRACRPYFIGQLRAEARP
jgi:hypothetical protein